MKIRFKKHLLAGSFLLLFADNVAADDLGKLFTLALPDLSNMVQFIRTVPILLSFQPLPDAKQYHFEIASDELFTKILFTGKTDTTTIKGPNLADGYYWIRIRGINDLGLQGQYASHRFRIDTQRYAPIIETPCDINLGPEQVPLFKWTETEQTQAYHFQLSRNEIFMVLLFDQLSVPENEYSPGPLEPGEYFWRVARIGSNGVKGPFSDPVKCYVVKPEEEEEEPIAEPAEVEPEIEEFVTVPDIESLNPPSDNPAIISAPPIVQPTPPSPS